LDLQNVRKKEMVGAKKDWTFCTNRGNCAFDCMLESKKEKGKRKKEKKSLNGFTKRRHRSFRRLHRNSSFRAT